MVWGCALATVNYVLGSFMKKYFAKILISVLLLFFSFLCYWLPPKPLTEIVKYSDNKTVQQEFNNGSKLFEWIGILFLALSVWTWRKELKLTSIGPISGSPLIEQRDAEEVSKEFIKKEQLDININSHEFNYHKEREEKYKNRIMELVKEKRAINSYNVASDLGLTKDTAEKYLYILSKEGKLRQDGFPRSIYTFASSIENMAIERLKKELEKKTEILSDRRFVRIKGKYEIDALLQGINQTFLIGLKFVRANIQRDTLLRTYEQLIKTSDALNKENVVLYLVLVTDDDSINHLLKITQNISFDSSKYPFVTKVYSQSELHSIRT